MMIIYEGFIIIFLRLYSLLLQHGAHHFICDTHGAGRDWCFAKKILSFTGVCEI